MASSKGRQRELARAKYHRQMARKATAERRRRQILAAVASAVAVLAIAGVAAWRLDLFGGDKKPSASDVCSWTPKNASSDPNAKDVGTPPTSGVAMSGTRKMNITFPGGLVETELNLTRAPCTSASFAYLASKNFFDNTKCHRLLNQGDYVLQCGDPTGTGQGGPSYSFADENLPTIPSAPPSAAPEASTTVVYPKGTIAMANGGPNTNGSQFFVVFQDSPFPPSYTVIGKVTSGLDVIAKIAAAGTVDNGQGEKSKPTNDVFIQSLTVGEVTAAGPTPTAPPTPSATPQS